jgi:hydrogenase nickel incorporation protein HypA/HybF
MHEYSIVQSLVNGVEAVARQHAGAAVHHVYVDIGELSGVDCDLLQTAYDTFRGGTLCETAPLTIERVGARWHCPNCGGAIPRGAILRCAICGEPARLASGDEIILKRVELEVP